MKKIMLSFLVMTISCFTATLPSTNYPFALDETIILPSAETINELLAPYYFGDVDLTLGECLGGVTTTPSEIYDDVRDYLSLIVDYHLRQLANSGGTDSAGVAHYLAAHSNLMQLDQIVRCVLQYYPEAIRSLEESGNLPIRLSATTASTVGRWILQCHPVVLDHLVTKALQKQRVAVHNEIRTARPVGVLD